MRAKVKGVEFEISDEKDLRLLSKFISQEEEEAIEEAIEKISNIVISQHKATSGKKVEKKMERKMENGTDSLFDIFSRNEDAHEKTNLYLAVLEHSMRKKQPLTVKEVSTVMQLSVGEAKALLMDTFQQQYKLYPRFNQKGKMVLKNQDTLEFQ